MRPAFRCTLIEASFFNTGLGDAVTMLRGAWVALLGLKGFATSRRQALKWSKSQTTVCPGKGPLHLLRTCLGSEVRMFRVHALYIRTSHLSHLRLAG